jgi:hypothetical protein
VLGSENEESFYLRSNPTPVGEDPPVIPSPVVSINDRGVGLAAYAENGNVIVHSFNGVAGFTDPVVVGSGVEEELDAVMAAGRARIAWRGEHGRVSVLSGDAQSGVWDTLVDVAAEQGGDPVFASGPGANLPRSFLAWRAAFEGTLATRGYGSISLRAPYELLTRYAPDEDVANTVFDLRTAASTAGTIAVWSAAQLSDLSVTHLYVAHGGGQAQRLATALGGVAPAIDIDEDGTALLAWARSEGLFFSRYDPSDNSWIEPSIIGAETAAIDDVQIAVAANRHAIVAWTVRNGGVWAAAYDFDTRGWYDVERMDGHIETSMIGRDPRVAIDDDGRATVVWRDEEGRVLVYRHGSDGWHTREYLGATQGAPDIDMNDAGLGVVVWWYRGFRSQILNGAQELAASFTYGPDPGIAGSSVLFDARASTGPFPITSVEWDWEDDGAFDGSGLVTSRVFETPGTYTTRVRVTDSAGQVAEATRTVNIVAVGAVSSQIVVSYTGPGDGLLEIHSSEPGFAPVRCSTTTPAGQPTNTGTCTATVLAGYEIAIVAQYDPVRSIFSGWPDGFRECAVVTSTTGGMTRSECQIIASSEDRSFDVTFAIAPPTTQILRVELHPVSQGAGEIFSLPAYVDCVVQNQSIQTRNGTNCNYSIDPRTTPTLTLFAVPERGRSRFLSWQGCDLPQPSPTECTVTMDGPRTVTALFSGG